MIHSIDNLKEKFLRVLIEFILNCTSFRILPEYNGYKVYESGIIRDIRTHEIIPMKHSESSPYFHVNLKNNQTGNIDDCSVHRLVARCFI